MKLIETENKIFIEKDQYSLWTLFPLWSLNKISKVEKVRKEGKNKQVSKQAKGTSQLDSQQEGK